MLVLRLGVILIATGLMYALGARLFSSKTCGVVVAVCFATTPLVILAAGSGSASLYQLPFVIGWLLCVERFRSSGAARDLAGAGAVLGLGVYSFWAAIVMMPVYLAITVLALVLASDLRLTDRRIAAMVAAFGIAVAPMAAYVTVHPEYLRDRILAYGLYDANRYNILQGAREVFSWVGLTARSEVYYDYFNPAFLFLSGGGLARSLARPQVFHLPYALLLGAGLHRIVTRDVPLTAWLAVAGFLAAPATAALTAQPPLAARRSRHPHGAVCGRDRRLRSAPHRGALATLALPIGDRPIDDCFVMDDYAMGDLNSPERS